MPHVFISYSHDDYDSASTLKVKLQEKGVNALMDEDLTSPGVPWSGDIQEAIDESYAILVICTNNSMTSNEVCFEWSYAMGKGIITIPLLYESNCALHSRLIRLHNLNFCDVRDRSYSISMLCEELEMLTDRGPFVNLPRKSGIEKILFSREELLREYSVAKILREAKPGSEILVVARTGEGWTREYQDLKILFKENPVKLKLAIVDPHIAKEQWMIVSDHGQHDVGASHSKMVEFLDTESGKDSIEIYHLPSSPLQSFVHFTDIKNCKIGILETGAGLSMKDRTILILRSSKLHESLMLDRLYDVFSRVFDENRLFRLPNKTAPP